jgi:hypothetical protein
MNDRDYELLSRHLDGLLGPDESAAFSQALLDDPEFGATHQAWKEIDMAARNAFPKTSFPRPSLPARRRSLWVRAAVAALVALTLGGLTWAAVEYFGAGEPSEAPEQTAPGIPAEEPSGSTGAADRSDRSDPADRSDQTSAPRGAAQEAPQSTVIKGRVVDANGEPVSGAQVSMFLRELVPAQDRALAYSVLSDTNGEFELPDSWSVDQCVVHKAGYMPVLVLLDFGFAGHSYSILVRLLQTATATGYVVDSDGRPLTGATLHSTMALFFPGAVDPFTTRDDGSFEAPLARGSGAFWVTYGDHAGFLLDALSPGIVLAADLRPGTALRVRVMQDGGPVNNALVSVDLPLPIPPTQRTDSDGFASFSNLRANSGCKIWASDINGYSAAIELDAKEMAPGASMPYLIELPSKGKSVLHGVVTAPDGRGVSGVVVSAMLANRENQYVALTDDAGRYAIPLGAGHYSVASTQPDRGMVFNPSSASEIVVSDGVADITRDIVMERTSPTTIPVRDAAGHAIERVEFCMDWRSNWSAVALLELDQGRLNTFTPDRTFYAIDPESGIAGIWAGATSKARNSTLTLNIPTGSVSGVAVDAEGHALPNLVVRADIRSRNLQDRQGWPAVYAKTDATGLFVLQPVPDVGDVIASVSISGYQPMDDVYDRPVTPGNAPDSLRIAFAPANARVAGRLLYADRTPAGEFSMTANSGPATWAYEESDDRGHFQFYVAAGSYQLQARASGDVASAVLDVTAPLENIEWVLPVQSPQQKAVAVAPSGQDHAVTTETLAALSNLFANFAADAEGRRYPGLVRQYGVFLPDLAEVRRLTGMTGTDLNRILGSYDGELCYLGHLVPDEPTAMAFLDAYETYGPDGIAGVDINTSEEAQQKGLPRVFQLREGIERFLITDINDPNAGGKARSKVPVIWELPGNHDESGGWVVYMDGRTEWLPYPGPFPMSEAFVTRVREIGGVAE